MQVLVVTGSRHGSTRDIGDRLASTLARLGIRARSCDVGDVTSLEGADAVVIGSAVYMGQWTDEARAFIDRFRGDLQRRPTWIFSSGPTGDPPKPEGDPPSHIEVRDLVEANGDRVFPGAIDTDHLGRGEKFITKLVRAKAGDYRPWDEIDEFAREIGRDLTKLDVQVTE